MPRCPRTPTIERYIPRAVIRASYVARCCAYTDRDCVRFRVDRRLIDVSQDRKNERDRSRPSRVYLNRSYPVRNAWQKVPRVCAG